MEIYSDKIHAVNDGGKRVYCGPAAISAITGYDCRGVVRDAINAALNRPRHRGVMRLSVTGLIDACRRLGAHAVPVQWAHTAGTLKQFIASLQEFERVPMIVHVTNHYVAIKGRLVIDNSNPEGEDVDDHPSRRKIVQRAWVFRKVGSTTPAINWKEGAYGFYATHAGSFFEMSQYRAGEDGRPEWHLKKDDHPIGKFATALDAKVAAANA